MVETEGTELPTPTQSSNRSLTSESGTEIFDAETGGQKLPFCLVETDAETHQDSKGPGPGGTSAKKFERSSTISTVEDPAKRKPVMRLGYQALVGRHCYSVIWISVWALVR